MPKSYSQKGLAQDLWVVKHHPRKGFFIDIGASHPTYESNTKLLEEKGWEGICIEPFPKVGVEWTKHRKAPLIRKVLADKKGKMKYISPGSNGGGLLKSMTRATRSDQKIIEVRTDTISGILEEHKVPVHVGYMSLDIEGAERMVIDTFPWNKIRPKLISVEHNCFCKDGDLRKRKQDRGYIQKFLRGKGYRRVENEFCNHRPICGDDFFILNK